MNQRPFSKTALSAAIISALSVPVLADDFVLEEIVVTAQKRAQSVNDLAVSVNAFTGENLKELGIVSATDMAQHTPGLTLTESNPTGVPIYTIRGMGFDDYSASSNSTVGVYVNEVSLPYPVMTGDMLFDVERVEVLKGPQGDLYGRNSTGGAINFITNKPQEEFSAGVSLDYGRYEYTKLEGFVTGSLADNLQGRLALSNVTQDAGIQKHASTGEKLGDKDKTALRAMVNWDVSNDLSVLVDVHAGEDDSDGWAQQTTGAFLAGPLVPLNPAEVGSNDPRSAAWSLKPKRDHESVGASVTVNWEFEDNYTLTSITAYDNFERDDDNDWDGTSTRNIDITNQTEIDSYSQELRVAYEGESLNWIAGIYLSTDTVDEGYLGDVADSQGSFGLFELVENRYEQDTDTRAIFGHAEFNLADEWRLTVGGRYTHEDRSIESCTYDVDGGAAFLYEVFGVRKPGDESFAQGDCVTLTASQSAFNFGTGFLEVPNTPYKETIVTENVSGKVTLDYMPSDAWLIYGSIGTGFKSGGFNGAFANDTSQLAPYAEEEVLAYEFGFKGTLLDSTMQLNGALFHYDYRDKQVTDVASTLFGNLTTTVNIPRSEIYGAELELQWRPLQGLDVKLGVSYLDTEVKKFVGAPTLNSATLPTGQVDYGSLGKDLPQAPEWQYNGMLAYEFALTDGLVMRAVTDFSYSDSYYTFIEQHEQWEVDDYWLVNARLAVAADDGSWEVALWGKNLEDKYYANSRAYGNDTFNVGAGAGNTYGLSFSYNWM